MVDDLTISQALTVQNGRVFANSQTVASHFGKRHDNVLQSIDRLECSAKFTALNFQASDYTDSTGRSLRAFNMTKDGFTFLVMGFKGREAARFKEAYIRRFNEMEAALRAPVMASQPLRAAQRMTHVQHHRPPHLPLFGT